MFMHSMVATLVLEVLFRHKRVNLHKDVQRKRDVDSDSGVFQVLVFHRQSVNSNVICLNCSVYIC